MSDSVSVERRCLWQRVEHDTSPPNGNCTGAPVFTWVNVFRNSFLRTTQFSSVNVGILETAEIRKRAESERI